MMTTDPPAGFRSFDEHMQLTTDANPDEFVGRPEYKVAGLDHLDEMRAHVLGLYRAVSPLHSFVDEGGQHWDSIPISQQPSLQTPEMAAYELPEPPEMESSDPMDGDSMPPGVVAIEPPFAQERYDPFGNPMCCEAGCIPMRRVTLADVARYPTLRHYTQRRSRRRGRHTPRHRHAIGEQRVDNLGARSNMTVWSPHPVSQSQFSLSQQWLSGGQGDNLQTVEGGWVVDPSEYHPPLNCPSCPALFIYMTPDNYATGYENLQGGKFVQMHGGWGLGSFLRPINSVESTLYWFGMQWKKDPFGWWLAIQGSAEKPRITSWVIVGHYPTETFNNGQMSKNSDDLQFGGETFDENAAEWPPMGAGSFPPEKYTFRTAAVHYNVQFLPTKPLSPLYPWRRATLTAESFASNTCYRAKIGKFMDGEMLAFGGPGGPGCPTGTS